MECDLYKVSTLNVNVARCMSLETALILVKALMVEYYADPDIEYTIKRESRTDAFSEDDSRADGLIVTAIK